MRSHLEQLLWILAGSAGAAFLLWVPLAAYFGLTAAVMWILGAIVGFEICVAVVDAFRAFVLEKEAKK